MSATEISDRFREAVARSLSTAMSARSDDRWEPQGQTGTRATPRTEDRVSAAVVLSGILNGELFLSIALDEIPSLRIASAASSIEAIWKEIASAAGEDLCAALGGNMGELSIRSCQVLTPSTDAHDFGEIALQSARENTHIVIATQIGATLMDDLQKSQGNKNITPDRETRRQPTTMDRVVDVPLSVTMRFGQRQLTLRELLDLSAGSLLELDRQIEEPVDLMLGERIIARGEVVIVDGNYGMRITEVLETSGRSGKRERAQPLGYASA